MRHNAAMKKVSIRDLPMRPGAVAQEAAEGEVIIVEKRGSRWRIYFDSAYLVKRYIWDKDSKKAVNLAQAVENGVFFRTVHRRSIACFVPARFEKKSLREDNRPTHAAGGALWHRRQVCFLL